MESNPAREQDSPATVGKQAEQEEAFLLRRTRSERVPRPLPVLPSIVAHQEHHWHESHQQHVKHTLPAAGRPLSARQPAPDKNWFDTVARAVDGSLVFLWKSLLVAGTITGVLFSLFCLCMILLTAATGGKDTFSLLAILGTLLYAGLLIFFLCRMSSMSRSLIRLPVKVEKMAGILTSISALLFCITMIWLGIGTGALDDQGKKEVIGMSVLILGEGFIIGGIVLGERRRKKRSSVPSEPQNLWTPGQQTKS